MHRHLRAWWCCALWIVSSLFSFAGAEELDLRVRMTWGGGEPRQWRGSIIAEHAQLLRPVNLGTDANGPDDLVLERDTLRFTQPIPVSSDGLEVQIIGNDDTKLFLEFVPLDKPEEVQKIELSLIDFISSSRFVYEGDLDERGNFLQVQRSPGDRLRVDFDRPSLVFDTGEQFEFSVEPHELGLTAGTALRCTVQLEPVDSDEVLWKEQQDVRVEASGSTQSVGPLRLTLPSDEGVYDIVVALSQRRFTDSLVPGKLVPAKPLLQRKVQLIVLGKEPLPPDSTEWSVVDEIDSSNPKWWERLNWLPHWKVLPGMAPRGPLGDRPLEAIDYQGQKLKQIAAGGWHAAPIPISEIGRPHVLEVEFPSDFRQTLGISVLEPDVAGGVAARGIDSGIENAGALGRDNKKLETHRIIFWPRTKNPWLVLANHRSSSPAIFGRVRVLAGPANLPTSIVPTAVRASVPGSRSRVLAAYYDKPLFADNFGAPGSLDEATGDSHMDWQTFYLGALRLVQYLKHAGYTTAIISAASEGGTLYPSQALMATPKFDDGRLFLSGQDPIQKNVLEMLFRIFDREGLKLIPAVQFGVPLPALEEQLRVGAGGLGGISMIGFLPRDPRPKYGHADARQGAAPFYNPLDARVQAAMREVVEELAAVGTGHSSFGGLAVQLSPYGYAVLPDDVWCLDDATFARFAAAAQQPNPDGADRFEQRMRIVVGDARDTWLEWRAEQLTTFYGSLADAVRKDAPDAEMLLLTTDLLNGRVLQNSLRPRLSSRPDVSDAMLRHGLDAQSLAETARVRVLRPHRISPIESISLNGLELDPSRSVMEEFFQRTAQNAAVNLIEPRRTELPGFDQVRPFGVPGTKTEFSAYFLRTGSERRARFVRDLAALDTPFLADGGSMLPLGNQDTTIEFVKFFSELPDEPFTTIPSATTGSSEIKVRMLHSNQGTYLYVVNPQSLAAIVKVRLETPAGCTATALTGHAAPQLTPAAGESTWVISLEPYDVAAIRCTGAVKVRGWDLQYDSESAASLTATVQELRVRMEQLDDFRPINVLENSNFELPSDGGQIPGWKTARIPGVRLELDTKEPYQGKQSLHLQVEGAKTLGWIKSDPFPLPKTGRLAVQAWLRTRNETQQPPLRISVSVVLENGQIYSRMSSIGMDVDSRTFEPTNKGPIPAVPQKWSAPVLLPLTDLPVGMAGQVTLGFDMLGDGEVWIDRVEVSDTYFDPAENKALVKNVASAIHKLQEGDLAYCEQVVQSYWSKFVLEYVPSPRVAQTPPPRAVPANPLGKPPDPSNDEKPSKWGKMLPTRIPFIQRR